MAGPTPRGIRNSELKSRILHVAQQSVYQVKLQPPAEVVAYLNSGSRGLNYSQSGEDVELMCSDVQLPGSDLITHDVTNDYAGVDEKLAYRRSYTNVAFTFMVNRRYDVIEMFDGWIDYISGMSEDQTQFANRYASYRVAYPNDYRSDGVYITKFEKDVGSDNASSYTDRMAIEYNFIGAYPISINPTAVGYGNKDVLKYTVNMNFIRYVRRRYQTS